MASSKVGTKVSPTMKGPLSKGYFKGGGSVDLSIDKNKRGVFSAKAKKAGMSTNAYARKIMAAAEGKYPPSLRKQANYALNASKWGK